jgi:acetyl coenzyme A synthetase (ADP forming)-like protein
VNDKAVGADDAGLGAGHVYEADVQLRDGSTVRVRPVHEEDEAAFLRFLRGLSERSRTLRFHGALGDTSLIRAAAGSAHVDAQASCGLVATVGRDGRIVGHAMYAPSHDGRAEVAFVIADDYQGRGLGTILLGQLAEIARERGLHTFEAQVMPENHSMLAVFRESGFPVHAHAGPGEIRATFPIELTEDAVARFEERDWTAAVNAVHSFFHPRSIAVIGASRDRNTIGAEILHNLLSYGFAGPVLPVNPKAPVVQSVLAYASVEEVPGPVDLAVIVVPFEHVQDVVDGCARKGVRSLVIISAGFAETGPEGRARQDSLLRSCRAAGMRLIGPNCMGILNTAETVRMNATFAPAPPPAGRAGFMSQSGALGLAIMDHASALGLGLSTFVSVGNKADISGNDLLRYWGDDPNTDLILLYLESFGNPRKFSRIARRVGRTKPIVAVKSGRSSAGARATGSHTGALIAASDVNVDALFRHAGVIRTDTLEEMFDVAALLSTQRPPRGRRVAILTNAGGPGILCADTCEAEGLVVTELDEATKRELNALLPREASVGNPVDMIASASAAQYGDALRILGRDPNVDALVVIFVPPLVTRPEDAARAITDAARECVKEKPVLAVFMQARGVPEELRTPDVRLPAYTFPEDAAIALARTAAYGEWLERPLAAPPVFADVRRDDATALIAAALGKGNDWLDAGGVASLLSCYGLPTLEQRLVDSVEKVSQAATGLGGDLALKAIAPGLIHKTEAGAVRLHLTPATAQAAAREMADALAAAGHGVTGFLLQRMAPPGIEMIVGVVHDRRFGPVVACGAGGILVELLKDVAVRLTPLSEEDAEEMVNELRTAPLLAGYRGAEPHDVAALRDIILRVATMVEDLPQITELDLNPVFVHVRGATIVDARVRVAAVEPEPLVGGRVP